MAKADRKLTLGEVLQGHVTEEYLDLKERQAIIERRIYNLTIKRDFLRDKISLVGVRTDLIEDLEKLNRKIEKLVAEYQAISAAKEATP